MPLQEIKLRPGINREGTDYSNEGGWYDANNVRFRSGLPEKIGGWVKVASTPFLGVARSLWNWVDLQGNNWVGFGTNFKYYILNSLFIQSSVGVNNGGQLFDITPVTSASGSYTAQVFNLTANPFSSAFSTLSANMLATDTTLTLTSAASFPTTGGIILIGTEQMSYTTVSGSTLTGLTRGINGTTAATHSSGNNVGCATVTVAITANGANIGQYVSFAGATTGGGFTPASLINDGSAISNTASTNQFQVIGVVDVNHFTINIANGATGGPLTFSTSAATFGGGSVTAQFQIALGPQYYTLGTGWSAGTWSTGTWSYSAAAGVGTQLQVWSQANWGGDLILAPRNGGLYYWVSSIGAGGGNSTRAVLLASLAVANSGVAADVPTQVGSVIVDSVRQFAIVLGSTAGLANTTFNPMLVRWSNQSNPFQWTETVTNTAAGEFPLTYGTQIIGGLITRQENLIWTDTTLYSMQYVGAPYIWGFNVLAFNISIQGPNAAVTVNGVTYWMGRDKFYIYDGTVRTLPCTVKQFIFDNVSKTQQFQVYAGSNTGFNEVWWFYCSVNSMTIDSYVVYNYVENLWFYGTMTRSAWIAEGVSPYPIAAGYDGYLYYHESAVDDNSTSPASPINAYIQSSDLEIGMGEEFAFVWRMLPDVNFNGSAVNMPYVNIALLPRRNAGYTFTSEAGNTVTSAQNYAAQNQYTYQQFSGQVYTRLRDRQMALRVSSNNVGTQWQLGTVRYDARPDGRR